MILLNVQKPMKVGMVAFTDEGIEAWIRGLPWVTI